MSPLLYDFAIDVSKQVYIRFLYKKKEVFIILGKSTLCK